MKGPESGREAFLQGWQPSACPHPARSVAAMLWLSDWWRANAECFAEHIGEPIAVRRVERLHTDRPPSAPGTLGSRAARTRQCSVTVDELCPESQGRMEWRQRHYGPRGLDPGRCAHRAEYRVDGREVCSRHAGMLSLEILMSEA